MSVMNGLDATVSSASSTTDNYSTAMSLSPDFCRQQSPSPTGSRSSLGSDATTTTAPPVEEDVNGLAAGGGLTGSRYYYGGGGSGWSSLTRGDGGGGFRGSTSSLALTGSFQSLLQLPQPGLTQHRRESIIETLEKKRRESVSARLRSLQQQFMHRSASVAGGEFDAGRSSSPPLFSPLPPPEVTVDLPVIGAGHQLPKRGRDGVLPRAPRRHSAAYQQVIAGCPFSVGRSETPSGIGDESAATAIRRHSLSASDGRRSATLSVFDDDGGIGEITTSSPTRATTLMMSPSTSFQTRFQTTSSGGAVSPTSTLTRSDANTMRDDRTETGYIRAEGVSNGMEERTKSQPSTSLFSPINGSAGMSNGTAAAAADGHHQQQQQRTSSWLHLQHRQSDVEFRRPEMPPSSSLGFPADAADDAERMTKLYSEDEEFDDEDDYGHLGAAACSCDDMSVDSFTFHQHSPTNYDDVGRPRRHPSPSGSTTSARSTQSTDRLLSSFVEPEEDSSSCSHLQHRHHDYDLRPTRPTNLPPPAAHHRHPLAPSSPPPAFDDGVAKRWSTSVSPRPLQSAISYPSIAAAAVEPLSPLQRRQSADIEDRMWNVPSSSSSSSAAMPSSKPPVYRSAISLSLSNPTQQSRTAALKTVKSPPPAAPSTSFSSAGVDSGPASTTTRYASNEDVRDSAAATHTSGQTAAAAPAERRHVSELRIQPLASSTERIFTGDDRGNPRAVAQLPPPPTTSPPVCLPTVQNYAQRDDVIGNDDDDDEVYEPPPPLPSTTQPPPAVASMSTRGRFNSWEDDDNTVRPSTSGLPLPPPSRPPPLAPRSDVTGAETVQPEVFDGGESNSFPVYHPQPSVTTSSPAAGPTTTICNGGNVAYHRKESRQQSLAALSHMPPSASGGVTSFAAPIVHATRSSPMVATESVLVDGRKLTAPADVARNETSIDNRVSYSSSSCRQEEAASVTASSTMAGSAQRKSSVSSTVCFEVRSPPPMSPPSPFVDHRKSSSASSAASGSDSEYRATRSAADRQAFTSALRFPLPPDGNCSGKKTVVEESTAAACRRGCNDTKSATVVGVSTTESDPVFEASRGSICAVDVDIQPPHQFRRSNARVAPQSTTDNGNQASSPLGSGTEVLFTRMNSGYQEEPRPTNFNRRSGSSCNSSNNNKMADVWNGGSGGGKSFRSTPAPPVASITNDVATTREKIIVPTAAVTKSAAAAAAAVKTAQRRKQTDAELSRSVDDDIRRRSWCPGSDAARVVPIAIEKKKKVGASTSAEPETTSSAAAAASHRRQHLSSAEFVAAERRKYETASYTDDDSYNRKSSMSSISSVRGVDDKAVEPTENIGVDRSVVRKDGSAYTTEAGRSAPSTPSWSTVTTTDEFIYAPTTATNRGGGEGDGGSVVNSQHRQMSKSIVTHSATFASTVGSHVKQQRGLHEERGVEQLGGGVAAPPSTTPAVSVDRSWESCAAPAGPRATATVRPRSTATTDESLLGRRGNVAGGGSSSSSSSKGLTTSTTDTSMTSRFVDYRGGVRSSSVSTERTVATATSTTGPSSPTSTTAAIIPVPVQHVTTVAVRKVAVERGGYRAAGDGGAAPAAGASCTVVPIQLQGDSNQRRAALPTLQATRTTTTASGIRASFGDVTSSTRTSTVATTTALLERNGVAANGGRVDPAAAAARERAVQLVDGCRRDAAAVGGSAMTDDGEAYDDEDDAGDAKTSKTFELDVVKSGLGLSFCIEGGKDSAMGDMPITIKRVFRESERLRPGDEILTANGRPLSMLSHYVAWNYLKSLPEGLIRLVVRRPGAAIASTATTASYQQQQQQHQQRVDVAT